MVRTGKIHHLEVKVLVLEVSRILEHDRELDAFKRTGLDFGDDPEEGCPAMAEVLPRDPHTVECVGIENIEATPVVHQHLRGACLPNDGVNDEQETT